MTTFDTPAGKCPSCGELLDAATDYTELHGKDKDRPPRAGDLFVCMYCAEVLEFTDGQTLQQATLKNLMRLSPKDSAAIDKTQKWIRTKRPKANETEKEERK